MRKCMIYIMIVLLLAGLSIITGCGPKPIAEESHLDTPENHYRLGMNELEDGHLNRAAEEFMRATALDPDYPGGYAGMGLVHAFKKEFKEALKQADKSLGKDKKFVDGYVAKGRIMTLHKKGDDWLKKTLKIFDKGLKLAENNEGLRFYKGIAYKEAFTFRKAASQFRRVIEIKGDLAGRANDEWELMQKIERAAPGTRIGMKIALMPEIDRSDLAVLFVEELKLLEVLKKRQPMKYDARFKTPDQVEAAASAELIPADIVEHWAKNWIRRIMDTGVMSTFPDGGFHPDDSISRANYATFLQSILMVVTSDDALATKYIGTPSRFPDVNATHFAYNAICLCVDRGIMSADTMTGAFLMRETVSGADALLIIRELQNALRMTF
ncbi:S-layer homology domain-containing protein [bacterium]|nr:S-layer homology domain-containing protein [bacterium]